MLGNTVLNRLNVSQFHFPRYNGRAKVRESDIRSAICEYLAYPQRLFFMADAGASDPKSADGCAFCKMPSTRAAACPT